MVIYVLESNYYDKIKKELINNEVYKQAKDYSKNRSDLNTYYNVGKLLAEAGKHYGESIIKNYSIRLTKEFNRQYSVRTLLKIRQFYIFIQSQKTPTVSAQLTWSHYYEVLMLNDINKINYYINIAEEQNLSVRQLHEKIKSSEYERLDENAKNKLINKEQSKVEDLINNPILIRNKNNINITKLSEKLLKQLILEDISGFMYELGNGFSYIDNEYKIKIGDRYNYVDLLLYNIKFNCYVVVELKVTELRKEHIGQIETYMNYIDRNVRILNQDKTIGIIICKKDNKFIMEYCNDERVFSKEYQLL